MRLLLAYLLLTLPAAAANLVNPYTFGRSTLNDGLVSYWKLEEASGTRADQLGVNDFTANNTPGQGVGKIGNCATFLSASSQSLSKVDNSSFDALTNAWTLAGWWKQSTLGAAKTVIGKDDFSTQRQFLLDVSSSRLTAYCFTNASTAAFLSVTANTFGNLSIDTWYFFCATFDRSTGVLKVSVNDVSDSISSVPACPKKTAPLAIAQGNKMDGSVDEVGLWSRALTSAEITELYRSGNGKTCCTFAAP